MHPHAMQEKAVQRCSFPKEELLGSWTMEQLRAMTVEFNTLDPQSATRAATIRRLFNAQKICHIRHGELHSIVPADNIHHDLCSEQLMCAARNHAIDQHINFSLTRKAPTPKEWDEIRQQAQQDAAREGKLPKPYERKYPDKPAAIAELNYHSRMITIKCHGRVAFKIPIGIIHLEIIPVHKGYADLRITTL